jgi:ubiquinone/menaquinone biosynthesis C-methylase UbiE
MELNHIGAKSDRELLLPIECDGQRIQARLQMPIRHLTRGRLPKPSLFWSGRLTLPTRVLVEANSVLALFTGSYGDIRSMKDRVKKGYEGEYSQHVRQYDALGYHLQDQAARIQLEGIGLHNMRVLDVGCGTGALARVACEDGARAAVCGDISAFMLNQAAAKETPGDVSFSLCQLDAEALPCQDDSFDAVISGMTFGLLPNQKKAIDEMVRVTRPGGLVSVGAHGPDHYWEAIDASFRCITKRYILGYRLEWWPRTEAFMRDVLEQAGLDGVRTRRVVYRNEFDNGSSAYDFFAAISASWWYAKFPPDEIANDSGKTRNYFERKDIRVITDDIIVASGYKPSVC